MENIDRLKYELSFYVDSKYRMPNDMNELSSYINQGHSHSKEYSSAQVNQITLDPSSHQLVEYKHTGNSPTFSFCLTFATNYNLDDSSYKSFTHPKGYYCKEYTLDSSRSELLKIPEDSLYDPSLKCGSDATKTLTGKLLAKNDHFYTIQKDDGSLTYARTSINIPEGISTIQIPSLLKINDIVTYKMDGCSHVLDLQSKKPIPDIDASKVETLKHLSVLVDSYYQFNKRPPCPDNSDYCGQGNIGVTLGPLYILKQIQQIEPADGTTWYDYSYDFYENGRYILSTGLSKLPKGCNAGQVVLAKNALDAKDEFWKHDNTDLNCIIH